jgi:hypothetical protein
LRTLRPDVGRSGRSGLRAAGCHSRLKITRAKHVLPTHQACAPGRATRIGMRGMSQVGRHVGAPGCASSAATSAVATVRRIATQRATIGTPAIRPWSLSSRANGGRGAISTRKARRRRRRRCNT